jgi:lysophospholipase L1-like esterase
MLAGWLKLLGIGVSVSFVGSVYAETFHQCATPAWSAAMQRAVDSNLYPGSDITLDRDTLRQIVRVNASGYGFTIAYSNIYGLQPLVIHHTTLARAQQDTSGIVGPNVEVTFNGHATITVLPGSTVTSDPIALIAKQGERLAISSYFLVPPDKTRDVHLVGQQTLYRTAGRDATSDQTLGATASTSRFFISRINACRPERTTTIVALGDSITDGTGSTLDANARWPDALADRLAKAGRDDLAVIDQGIDGNRLLHGRWGDSALARLDRDVLSIPGVSYLIILEGINDIYVPEFLNKPEDSVTANEMIGAYKTIIERAHRRGVKVLLGTLMPTKGAETHYTGYYSKNGDTKRQVVNEWIRTGGMADNVIDFDIVMRDPRQQDALNRAYDSGDHLHPNDAGYRAMAAAIDLGSFPE